jgi:hypothetical protein
MEESCEKMSLIPFGYVPICITIYDCEGKLAKNQKRLRHPRGVVGPHQTFKDRCHSLYWLQQEQRMVFLQVDPTTPIINVLQGIEGWNNVFQRDGTTYEWLQSKDSSVGRQSTWLVGSGREILDPKTTLQELIDTNVASLAGQGGIRHLAMGESNFIKELNDIADEEEEAQKAIEQRLQTRFDRVKLNGTTHMKPSHVAGSVDIENCFPNISSTTRDSGVLETAHSMLSLKQKNGEKRMQTETDINSLKRLKPVSLTTLDYCNLPPAAPYMFSKKEQFELDSDHSY